MCIISSSKLGCGKKLTLHDLQLHVQWQIRQYGQQKLEALSPLAKTVDKNHLKVSKSDRLVNLNQAHLEGRLRW